MKRLAVRMLRQAPWLLAGAIFLVLVLRFPEFRKARYWLVLGRLYFPAAALALALTPIILTGGIDLSVGSVTVFSSVIIGVLWQHLGWSIGWAVAGGVMAGLLAGVANGLLVTAGVLPLVATLATRELFRGLALTMSGDTPVTRFPDVLNEVWRGPLLGLPLPLTVLGLLFLVTYVVVHHTWVGPMTYAMGDNEEAARFAGVPVRGIKLGLYAWSGLVAGLCGAGLVMHYAAAKADEHKSLELLAIACVVLGGIRITGGGGHVAGTVLGTITMIALLTGLTRIGSSWRDTVSGAVLVALAVINEASARWADRLAAADTQRHP